MVAGNGGRRSLESAAVAVDVDVDAVGYVAMVALVVAVTMVAAAFAAVGDDDGFAEVVSSPEEFVLLGLE